MVVPQASLFVRGPLVGAGGVEHLRLPTEVVELEQVPRQPHPHSHSPAPTSAVAASWLTCH